MSAKDIFGLWCDDITFCPNKCELIDCPRNQENIRDRTIPHSYSVETPTDCPKNNISEVSNKYAIEVLEQQKLKLQGYNCDYSLLWNAYDKAIDALWKKESTIIGNINHPSAKPIKKDENHYYCGACAKRISLKTNPNFCCKCGARIEWEKKDVK